MSDTLTITQLSVVIKKPQRIEFKGVAKAITSVNSKGKFDVLPYHENFISLIKDSVTVHLDDKNIKTYDLKNGVLKVNGNTVTILIGIEM
jgi:F0F1-type ATP synthase epsilon subunit